MQWLEITAHIFKEQYSENMFALLYLKNINLIISIAIHSETEEEMVVYRQMYGNLDTYVRPLSMFLSEVDHEKYPNIKQKYRFERRIAEKQEDV